MKKRRTVFVFDDQWATPWKPFESIEWAVKTDLGTRGTELVLEGLKLGRGKAAIPRSPEDSSTTSVPCTRTSSSPCPGSVR